MHYYQFVTNSRKGRELSDRTLLLALKRGLEPCFCALLLVLFLPLWLFKRATARQAITIYTTNNTLSLAAPAGVSDFFELQKQPFYTLVPIFWEIVRGRMALVGPAPVETEEEPPLYQTFGLKPGLFSTYSLKRQANLTLLDRDYELLTYVGKAGLKTDLGILVRSLIGRRFNSAASLHPESFELLDVRVDNLEIDEALEWICRSARDRSHTDQLAFANPDCFNIATKHPEYRKTLQKAERVFADGIGVHLACGMLDVSMKANLNGTDLFPRLCELAQAENLSIYLLGARPGIVDKMVAAVAAQYPSLKIAGARHGYFDESEETGVIEQINASNAHILLLALGAPRQEIWIAKHRDNLKVGLALGVGGLFDFVSGSMPRAPLWMREIGLEWCYRLYQEPRRMWRRYIIGNPLFLFRVWRFHVKRRQKNCNA